MTAPGNNYPALRLQQLLSLARSAFLAMGKNASSHGDQETVEIFNRLGRETDRHLTELDLVELKMEGIMPVPSDDSDNVPI
jgi:hypothetical protein